MRFVWICMLLPSLAVCLVASEVSEDWVSSLRERAPEQATVKPIKERKLLLFSLITGYKHKVTPFTSAVVRVLGEKTGAYMVVESNDLAWFEPDKIKQFDVIVLNNNCSDRSKRNLFWDATKDMAVAERLESSLLDHIASGKGLVVLHGGIVMLNKSPRFGEMVGGAFDFHPKHQQVTCKLVDPKHPLLAPFKGEPFVHNDEPYCYKGAYMDMNFKPLLEMDVDKLNVRMKPERLRSVKRYVAWIKRYGEGRVFYCSPSHDHASYQQVSLLTFILNGIQYAAGDLECDDQPLKKS